jgi:hypothetical protein
MTCDLYYKTITIVIMTIVSDVTIWLRLGSSITIVSSFIIQANVITIVNYNRKTFIVQATGVLDLVNHFQPGIIFVGKDRCLLYVGGHDKY